MTQTKRRTAKIILTIVLVLLGLAALPTLTGCSGHAPAPAPVKRNITWDRGGLEKPVKPAKLTDEAPAPVEAAP